MSYGSTHPKTVAFVCLHGSAKSLIAAEYLTRTARARGLNFLGTTSGPEPDAEIPENVVAGLSERMIDVRGRIPALVSADALAHADHIVSFGCDLTALVAPGRRVETWADCPAVSDDFDTAWTYIAQRVDRLLESMPDAAPRRG
jgi:protein-tyrosine-phosphatase